MKRIKLFLAAAIAAIVSVAAGLYSYNATQENLLAQEQELVLVDESVEALTFCEASVSVGFFTSVAIICSGEDGKCGAKFDDKDALVCDGSLVSGSASGLAKKRVTFY